MERLGPLDEQRGNQGIEEGGNYNLAHYAADGSYNAAVKAALCVGDKVEHRHGQVLANCGLKYTQHYPDSRQNDCRQQGQRVFQRVDKALNVVPQNLSYTWCLLVFHKQYV